MCHRRNVWTSTSSSFVLYSHNSKCHGNSPAIFLAYLSFGSWTIRVNIFLLSLLFLSHLTSPYCLISCRARDWHARRTTGVFAEKITMVSAVVGESTQQKVKRSRSWHWSCSSKYCKSSWKNGGCLLYINKTSLSKKGGCQCLFVCSRQSKVWS